MDSTIGRRDFVTIAGGATLQNVEMLGRPTRVAASENSSVGPPVVVPALAVRGFFVSSVSDAI